MFRGISGNTIYIMENIEKIAKNYSIEKRNQLRIPLIGVTGSHGKTSFKELAASLLEEKYKVCKNEGSRNIADTMILNILSISPEDQIAIFEFGVDAEGQMSEMVDIARPTIPVITGLGQSHLASFSSKKAIYNEKSHIIDSLPPKGKILVNGQDEDLMTYLREDSRIDEDQIISYGFSEASTLYASNISYNGLKGVTATIHPERLGINAFEIDTPLLGEAMLLTALGSLLLALLLKVPVDKIQKKLNNYVGFPERMQLITKGQVTYINDAYNASPSSVTLALNFIGNLQYPGRKIAILGDMLELGKIEYEAHKTIGCLAYECADVIICIGPLGHIIYESVLRTEEYMKLNKEVLYFEGTDSFIEVQNNIIHSGDLILLKASNKMEFYKICQKYK